MAMAWNEQEVQAAQNAVPTDFSAFDRQLQFISDGNAQRFAGDSRLYVTFYMRPLVNDEKSQQAGRPIFEDREFIRIMIPGDKQNIIDRVAEDFDRQRFPQHYERFRAGVEQVIGTPLEHTGIFPPSKCEEYKAVGIRTVENMAAAADNLAPRFMSFHQDKQAAQAWLAKRSSSEVLLAQIEELKRQVAALQPAAAPSSGYEAFVPAKRTRRELM
jgi:hypothetical protein